MRYFDYNATSPLCDAARLAWLEAVAQGPGNPASPHRLGARAERALEDARDAVAGMFGVQGQDIVWTSGATEANNAVLHHVAEAGSPEVWVSAIEHPCVLAAAARWFPGRHRLIPVRPDGVVDVAWLAEELKCRRPGLVGVMAANNETGILQPWIEILSLCRQHGVPYFCDAAQWLGKLPARGLGECAYVTGCAHKFGGPPGIGFLKGPADFRALLVGGPQEGGRRAGTANVPGAVACAAALRQREAMLAAQGSDEWARGRDEFEGTLAQAIPGLEVLGRGKPRLWNTSTILMPRVDCRRRWVVGLDGQGFAASTGSACSSGQEETSHVLAAMGIDGRGERMLRLSGGWETTVEDWQALGSGLRAVAARFGVFSEGKPRRG